MNKTLLTTIIFSGIATLGANAAILINVDFNHGGSTTHSGAAAIGSSGDIWNGMTNNMLNLVDSTNTATAIDVDVTVKQGTWSAGSGTTMDAGTSDLMQDYSYGQNSTPVTVSFEDLGAYAGQTFELYIYAAGDATDQGATITLTGGVSGGNTGNTLLTTNASRKISDGVGVAYQVFTGTLSGADFTFTSAQTGGQEYVTVNGAQLNIIPEPSATALLIGGMGALMIGLRRRR